LGFTSPISLINKFFQKYNQQPFLQKAKTFAFHPIKLRPNESEIQKKLSIIYDAIWLLRSSQFSLSDRIFDQRFGSPEFSSLYIDEYSLVNMLKSFPVFLGSVRSPIQPYIIDRAWKNRMKSHFFNPLLNIINRKVNVKKSKWRQKIIRASILAARSIYSTELIDSFLKDIIAIETLLVPEEGQKTFLISKRIEGMFGWLYSNVNIKWKDKIERIYNLRSEYVHYGVINGIFGYDLAVADELLFNLLRTICKLIRRFPNQGSIINYANEVNARKILGIKPWSKEGIEFLKFNISPNTVEKIEKKFHIDR